MKSLLAACVMALLCVAGIAGAEPAAAPWIHAQDVLKAAQTDIAQNGINGVGAHVDAIEKTLDECAACFPRYDTGSGDIFVLTSGMTETLMALGGGVAAQKEGKLRAAKIVAVDNPYPLLALYLGSYYNELRRYDDAVRVLDKGLKLFAEPAFADMVPYLAGERALALAQGGHLQDALAAYDEALKLPMLDDKGKARMQRGRGYIFVEMGRLDDGEAAYKESLTLDPGNKNALGELEYIAKLKQGGPKLPGDIGLPNGKPNAN
jgi:tetratricopeptide (TPR) repeat protein